MPTNAADVNGTSISQASLNSDVSAIAGSAYYQCYLNSQAYLSSSGGEQLPPVTGAGKGQDGAGDHPTATSAFVATYLDTEVGHQLVLQLADARHVTVTPAQLTDARASLSGQISQVMSEVLQTAQGQNVHYSCSVTGQPLTGEEVLSTVPASFVDQQVQFVATASALQEDLAGVGSSATDLEGYFLRHQAEFDTACWTVGVYSSQSAAQASAAEVAFGTPFSQVAAKATQGGPQTCEMLPIIAVRARRRHSKLRRYRRAPSRHPSMTTGLTSSCRSRRGLRRRTPRPRRSSPRWCRRRGRRRPRRPSRRPSATPR